jgi:preprotein translocase subunit SecE
LYLEIGRIAGRCSKNRLPRLREWYEKEATIMAINPAKFIREVRSEVGKVTWPTRRETLVSTAMVLILACVAALFFLAVDGIFAYAISAILGLGK